MIIHLPRAPGSEAREEFVAVNGKAYLIKKGQDVDVPECVYEVLKNKNREVSAADDFAKAKAALLGL